MPGRYVHELIKMKDTFIDPLLHPFSNSNPVSPLGSTPNLEFDYFRSDSPQPEGSSDNLPPIAARFMSPSPVLSPHGQDSPNPNMDADSIVMTDDDDENVDTLGQPYNSPQRKPNPTAQQAKMNHPRSPYRSAATKTTPSKSVPFPSRSHQSLPPPPRAQMTASAHSLGRQTSMADRGERERNLSQGNGTLAERKSNSPAKTNILRKFKKSTTSRDSVFGIGAIPPHLLPEDLKVCLEVIDNGVLDGHKRLSEALKKRYDDQFPLVRSLADVFVSNVSYLTYTVCEGLNVCSSTTYFKDMQLMSSTWNVPSDRWTTLSLRCPTRNPKTRMLLTTKKCAPSFTSLRSPHKKGAKRVLQSQYPNHSNASSSTPSFSRTCCFTPTRVLSSMRALYRWSQRSRQL